MDKNKILEQVKINQLENVEYDFLIAQLCVLNNKTYEEIKKDVDQLLFERKIEAINVPEVVLNPQAKESNKLDYMKFAKKKNKKV